MKFLNLKKINKDRFKPTRNSMIELFLWLFISFILFLFTEVLCAKGTTSEGYIVPDTVYTGIGIILVIALSMAFVFFKNKKWYYIGEAVLILAMVPLIVSTWEKFFIYLDVPDKSIWCLLLEYLIVAIILSPALVLKKKVFYYLISIGILMILSFCNYFVSVFRGLPLTFSDIYCIGDAIAVAKSYLNAQNITIMIVAVVAFIFILVFAFIKEKRKYRVSCYSNIIFMLLLFVGTYTYYVSLINAEILIYYSANMVKTYRYNGYVYSTIESCLRFIRFEPDGYNQERIAAIRDEVDKKTVQRDSVKYASGNLDISDLNVSNDANKPNVLFVQLEGFMDPFAIDKVLYSQDPIPNFRKLKENGISGQMKTPSVGGGTARTEFEVMTGIDLEFLTDGEVPHYTILGHKSLNSVASTLKKQGYTAHAIHNNQGNFYNRNKAYRALGYDTFTSLEYMNDVQKTETSWAKDTVLTPYIKNCLDSTEGTDLVFTISVEGHSPYPRDADKYDLPIKITSSNLPKKETNQIYYYANIIHESDQFVGELVELVDSLEEDTIVVFYGDHTPALDVLNRGGVDADRTTTPYAIYSNFDLGTDIEGGDISAYQMSTLMLSLAGLNFGPMENLHSSLVNEESYKENLELVEYDILFGKDYYLSSEEKTIPTNLRMGTKDIVIDDIEIEDDRDVYIKGGEFTRKSIVFVNGKEVGTIWIDKNTLKIVHYQDKIENIVVKQIGLREISLSESNVFEVNEENTN